ncbi:MAG: hypothetical protein JRI45_06820 [Deltaproteobacteria bacterium]|nr:hypothetical protein [Deltaproteobacteria bacterium]
MAKRYTNFAPNIYKKSKEDAVFNRIEKVIARAASYGTSAISFFCWLHTNKKEHKHLNYRTPLTWKGLLSKSLDMEIPCYRYWELYRRFLALCKKHGMATIPQAFMSKYTFYPFEGHNKQDIKDFWAPNAKKYQKWLIWRFLIEQKRLGLEPHIKFINEPTHKGRDDLGHIIAKWHKDMWLHAKAMTGLKLENLVIDISHSEFAKAELVYHGRNNACVKCGRPWSNVKEYDRLALCEQHGCSTKDSLYEGEKDIDTFIGSANWRAKFSEDGSKQGKIAPLGRDYPWRLGNAKEVKEMLLFAWGKCKNARKKKHFYFGLFPMETLKKRSWGLEEFYDIDGIDWSRFQAVHDAYIEIYGG